MSTDQRDAIHALARAGMHIQAEIAGSEYGGDGVWGE
jgi:hypothetical protein